MIFSDDDINTTTSSQYIMYPSSINGITVNNGGTNNNVSYTQINIVGGGGSGVIATPTISGGAISSISVTNSGIVIITSLVITNAGTGCITIPTITITSGVPF
jgi:hypothetical protein